LSSGVGVFARLDASYFNFEYHTLPVCVCVCVCVCVSVCVFVIEFFF